MEQELLTLPEHPSSPSVFSGVRVTRSLVLYVCFVDRCLSFCTFSFGHCVVCSSSIYDSDYSFGIFKLFLIIIEGFVFILKVCPNLKSVSVRRSRDHMVVGFTTTYAISSYHHQHVVSSNPNQAIQHYVIKFVRD